MKGSETAPDTIAYFGYGSLVNLATLRTPYISAHRARLRGWKRTWLARPRDVQGFATIDGLAFLSVTRDPDSVIDGIVIVDHRASLPDLDKREKLYTRQSIKHSDCSFLDVDGLGSGTDIFLYEADATVALPEDQSPRILRSYLDAVCQGFHHHFGEQGLADFKTSTDNFHFSILEDNGDPLYPRPVKLTPDERAAFDAHFPTSGEISK